MKLRRMRRAILNTDIMAFSGVSGSMEEDFFTKTPILKNCSSERKSSCRTCAEACHSPFKEIGIFRSMVLSEF